MKFSEQWSRRDMMKALGMGVAGAATISVSDRNAFARNPEASRIYGSRGGRSLYQQPEEPSSAALIKGNDRSENIYKALKLIENQVFSGIKGKQILIKPNFVQTSNQLAATHVDAIRGILEFLRPHYKKEILDRRSGGHQGRHDGRVQELRVPRPGAKVQSQTSRSESGRI